MLQRIFNPLCGKVCYCCGALLQPQQQSKEWTFEEEGFTGFKKLKYDAAQATFVSDNTQVYSARIKACVEGKMY